MAVSFVPFRSAFNSARRQVDPTIRVVEPGSGDNFLEASPQNFPMRFFNQVYNEFKNGIPGMSEDLPERLNWIDATPMYSAGIYGDQFLPPEYPWMRSILQFFPQSAAAIGNTVSVLDRELASLHGKGAEFRGPSANDWGGANRLSAAELNRYITITATLKAPNNGPVLADALKDLIKSDFYQGLPRVEALSDKPSPRAQAISNVIEGYKKRGKQEYENQNPVFANRIRSAEDANNLVKFEALYGYNPLLFPKVGK